MKHYLSFLDFDAQVMESILQQCQRGFDSREFGQPRPNFLYFRFLFNFTFQKANSKHKIVASMKYLK